MNYIKYSLLNALCPIHQIKFWPLQICLFFYNKLIKYTVQWRETSTVHQNEVEFADAIMKSFENNFKLVQCLWVLADCIIRCYFDVVNSLTICDYESLTNFKTHDPSFWSLFISKFFQIWCRVASGYYFTKYCYQISVTIYLFVV